MSKTAIVVQALVGASLAIAQTTTLSKEYIYFGGEIVAVESTLPTAPPPPVQPTGTNRAVLRYPPPGTTFAVGSETFSWSAGVGAQDYWLDIGTSLGSGNISNGVVAGTSKAVSGMPCSNSTIFARLWTRIGGVWQTPLDYTYTCNNGDPRARLWREIPGSVLLGSTQLFVWTPGYNALDYWLDIGTAPAQGNISNGLVTGTSKNVANITCTNTPIYARLYTRLASGYQTPIDYTYTCNSGDQRAQLVSQMPGSKLTTPGHMFVWTAGVGATKYWLDVGSAVGSGNYCAGEWTNTSRFADAYGTAGSTCTLPPVGQTVYVRLWSFINGSWYTATPFDYQFSGTP